MTNNNNALTEVFKWQMMKFVIEMCAGYYGVPIGDIMGRNRKKELVWARAMAVYLMYKHINLSLKEIGDFFNGMHHTSAANLRNKVYRSRLNPKAQSDIWAIERRFPWVR